MTATAENHEITRKAIKQEDVTWVSPEGAIWLIANCSCGDHSHLATKAGPITRWINAHLASAS